MTLNFRKVLFFVITTVGLLLAIVLFLGTKQFFLYRHYTEVSSKSEQLVFSFSNIKEHITEALIAGNSLDIKKNIEDIQKLNVDITTILNDILIPDEYKLIFINQIDLGAIILQLKEIRDGQAASNENRIKLSANLRQLYNRLERFDQVIRHHVSVQLAGFQKIVVGILGFVIFTLVTMFLLWNRKVAAPLLSLMKQLHACRTEKACTVSVSNATHEIVQIASTFNELNRENIKNRKRSEMTDTLMEIFHQINQLAEKNYEENDFLSRTCRILLSNQDYCLVWTGIKDPDGDDIMPVAADGCTTMDDSECSRCMTILLTSAEEKGIDSNPALMAYQKDETVVLRNILKDFPTGSIRNTPLASGFASCAALPIRTFFPDSDKMNKKVYGVICIYSTIQDSFSEYELKILKTITAQISKILSIIKQREFLEQSSFHRTEMDSLKSKLRRRCRLASVGELSAGIAHEVNNLINGTINYAQVLLDQVSDNSTEAKLLLKIITEGEHIADIESKLIAFISDSSESAFLKPAEVISDTISLMKHQLKIDGIETEIIFDEELPEIRMNPEKFIQVLINILNNSRHALNSKYLEGDINKKIIVNLTSPKEQEKGRQVVIAIKDYGCGIKKEFIEEIYKPFFTTKSETEATGLGLSICKELVNENGGTINTESVENEFTTVTITLPAK